MNENSDHTIVNDQIVERRQYDSYGTGIVWLRKQKEIREHLKKGDQCLNEVNYRQATVQYSKAIECGCKQASLFTNRAMCYLKTNYYAQAKLDCDSAIELECNYLNALCIRSICLSKLERYVEAVADCNHAIEIDKRCVNAYYQRAVIFMKLNEEEKIESGLKMVLRINPNHSGAKRDLEILQNSAPNSNSPVPSKHQCRYCKKLFIRRKILLVHLYRHTGKMAFKCRNCKKRFISKRILNQHTMWCSEGQPNLECPICQRKFDNHKGLAVHQRYHPDFTPSFCCSICKKEFRFNYTLRIHMKSHEKMNCTTESQNSAFCCMDCGEAFNEQSLLLIHHQTTHQEENEFIKDGKFSCIICQKLCRNKPDLRIHYRKHIGERPHKCPVCDKSFTSGSKLYEHRKNVHNDIPGPFHYVCSYCDQAYKNESTLKVHLTRHQQKADHPYKCDGCGWVFEKELTLRRHELKVHYDACPYCHKSISNKQTLINHVETVHTQQRKLPPPKPRQPCPRCEKVLRFASIKKHLEDGCYSHSLDYDKPSICDYCNKEYATRNSVAKHIVNVHFGIKQWLCNLCGKRYQCRINTKIHLNYYHKKNLNHCPLIECLLCLTKFTNPAALAKHEYMYHSEKATVKTFEFLCDHCNNDNGFTSKAGLISHIATYHDAAWLFKCPKCGKTFAHEAVCVVHMTTCGKRPKRKMGTMQIAFGGEKTFTVDLSDKSSGAGNTDNESQISEDDLPRASKEKNRDETWKGAKKKHISGEFKVRCKACDLVIRRGNWVEHVAVRHFSKPAITCQLCGYESKWRTRILKRHFAKDHPNQNFQITDRRKELLPEIYEISNGIKELCPSQMRVVPRASKDKRTKTKDETWRGAKKKNRSGDFKIRCKACDRVLRRGNWVEHVAVRHFSKPAITCHLCGYESKWQTGNMKKHFAKDHPNQKLQITDRRKELLPEIYEISDGIKEVLK